MMQRRDTKSGVSADVDFFTEPTHAQADDFKRISAPGRAAHVADDGVPTLTKAELTEVIFEHVGLNKLEAKDMVEAFFDEISDALERGESVKLTGFGNFHLQDKVSRPGWNPKTGVEVEIPARRVVTFQASQKLKTTTDESARSRPSEQVNEITHA